MQTIEVSKDIEKEILLNLNQKLYENNTISYQIYSKAKAKIEKL